MLQVKAILRNRRAALQKEGIFRREDMQLHCADGQRLNERADSFQRALVHSSEDSARQLLIEGVDFIDTNRPRTVELPVCQIG